MEGLIRKQYLFDPETGIGGGCYLFVSRAVAEAVFDDGWRSMIKDRYGAEPTIQIFETPIVVDNVSGEIVGVGVISA